MVKLDLKDKKILYELDKNSRASNSQIAKKVRLNKNTVNYKIKRLQDLGVIKGYYAVIDSSKLGYFSVRVYLKFFNTTNEQETELIDWLKKHDQIGVIAKIEQFYDLMFIVYMKDIYKFDKIWMEFKTRFRKYFWKEKVQIFSRVFHYPRKYLTQDKPLKQDFQIIGEQEIINYDELDFNILKILSKDARTPLLEISGKLKTPARTIAFRIKRLESKNVIQAYRVHIDLEKIGYEYYKINFILNNFEKYNIFLQFCNMHANIIFFDRTISEYDFEIDVEIKSKKELLNLLKEIKNKFNIRNAEVFTYEQYYKLESMPQAYN